MSKKPSHDQYGKVITEVEKRISKALSDSSSFQLKLALWISRFFDIHIVGTATLVLAIWQGLASGTRWRFLLGVGFFDIFLPFLFFLYLFRKQKVSDWWVSKRHERLPIFIFTAFCHFLGIMAASWFGKLEIMRLLLSFYMLFMVFMGVMTVYKISLHAGIISTLSFMLVTFYGPWFWLMYLLVALVAWARVKIHAHKPFEVILGMALPPVVLWLSFRFWGQPILCGSC